MTVGAASFQGTSSTNTGNAHHHDLGDAGDRNFFPRTRCERIGISGCAVAHARASDIRYFAQRLVTYMRTPASLNCRGAPHPRRSFSSATRPRSCFGCTDSRSLRRCRKPASTSSPTPHGRCSRTRRTGISTCWPTTFGLRPAGSTVPGSALCACRRTFATCPPLTALRQCVALCHHRTCAIQSCRSAPHHLKSPPDPVRRAAGLRTHCRYTAGAGDQHQKSGLSP